MTLQAVQIRTRELNRDHFMFGGWHNWFGKCPHCETVQKLKVLEAKYLGESVQQ